MSVMLLDWQVSANKWFLPLVWTAHLIALALEEDRELCALILMLDHVDFTGERRSIFG
jgi:hypothetical protein